MSTSDPQSPTVLTTTASDIEAAAIVTALSAHGIEARTTGGYTAGFRAEAPGRIQVVVRAADLAEAQVILAEIQKPTESEDSSDEQ